MIQTFFIQSRKNQKKATLIKRKIPKRKRKVRKIFCFLCFIKASHFFLPAVRKRVFLGHDAIQKYVFSYYWQRKINFSPRPYKKMPQIVVCHYRFRFRLQFTFGSGHSLFLRPTIKMYYIYSEIFTA